MTKLTARYEKIPDYFVARYAEEIIAWGSNYDKIGPVKSIVLKEGRLSDVSPDDEVGAVLRQVKLKAAFSGLGTVRPKWTVTPATDEDERKIRNHVQKMEAAGWPARLFDKEPARPWIPFMPTIDPQERTN